MLLSAVSVLVVAQASSEIPEGLMNNPVYYSRDIYTRDTTAEGTAVAGLVHSYTENLIFSLFFEVYM